MPSVVAQPDVVDPGKVESGEPMIHCADAVVNAIGFWYKGLPPVYAPAGRILWPAEIAAAAVYWLADESGPISGQVTDIEQHPFIGRNPPKDSSTIKTSK